MQYHFIGLFYFLWMNYDEEKILTLFGERLKQLRKEKGFSNYEQFAYTYYFNRVQYRRYEKGCNISLKTLLKILSFHNMTQSELFDHSFDKDPD